MGTVFIPFDGWNPSGGQFGDGWANVNDLWSVFGSWRPIRQFAPVGSGVADKPVNGAHVHRWMAGANSTSYLPDGQTVFAGTALHLYTVNPDTGAFTNVSRAAAYSNFPGGWRFATVGNDIWACNWADVMQRRTANTGNFADGVVSTFVPVPRFLAPVREHLLVANLNQAGRFQDEVAWSDADNPTNYDAPTLTSTSIAGSKRLTSTPGQIYGLVGGQYALAFKRKSVFYLEYTGTSQVFRPDVLSPHIGTAYPNSIINSRYGIFFLGSDGFYKIQDLSAPAKISPPGVDQILLDSGFTSFVPTNFSAALEDAQIIGFDHPMIPLVGWLYKAQGQPGGLNFILYDPATDVWSQAGPASPVGARLFWNFALTRPYAADLYSALTVFAEDSTNSYYAPMGSLTGAPVLQLRYRPANFADAGKYKQSSINWILPIFSKVGGTGAAALSPQITVDALLNPFGDVWVSETRVAADRDSVSGAYPFMIAGRLFRITITCAAEDFAHFDGIWVDENLLGATQ